MARRKRGGVGWGGVGWVGWVGSKQMCGTVIKQPAMVSSRRSKRSGRSRKKNRKSRRSDRVRGGGGGDEVLIKELTNKLIQCRRIADFLADAAADDEYRKAVSQITGGAQANSFAIPFSMKPIFLTLLFLQTPTYHSNKTQNPSPSIQRPCGNRGGNRVETVGGGTVGNRGETVWEPWGEPWGEPCGNRVETVQHTIHHTTPTPYQSFHRPFVTKPKTTHRYETKNAPTNHFIAGNGFLLSDQRFPLVQTNAPSHGPESWAGIGIIPPPSFTS